MSGRSHRNQKNRKARKTVKTPAQGKGGRSAELKKSRSKRGRPAEDSVKQHYERLGLETGDLAALDRVLRQYRTHENVVGYQQHLAHYLGCGDEASAEKMYQFMYETQVPSLQMTFADAFQVERFFLNAVELPLMHNLCANANSVLDAGCGDGVVLTYLANAWPKTRFVGVDRLPQAIDRCNSRIQKLDLANATAVIGDVFILPDDLKGEFDVVIFRTVVDDVREAYTPWSAVKYNAAFKLTEVGKALKKGGRIWMSMSAGYTYLERFLHQIQEDIRQADFGIVDFHNFPRPDSSLTHTIYELCSIHDDE